MSQVRNLLFKTFLPEVEILDSVYFTQGTAVDTGVVLSQNFYLDARFSSDAPIESNYYFAGCGSTVAHSNKFFIQARPSTNAYYVALGSNAVPFASVGSISDNTTIHIENGSQTVTTGTEQSTFTRTYGEYLGTSTNSLVIGGFKTDRGVSNVVFAGSFDYLDINNDGESYHFVGAKVSNSIIAIYDTAHDVVIYPLSGELQEL